MSTEPNAYIDRSPGDLLTAEDWNDLQTRIKQDIKKQIQDAVAQIRHVAEADNAHRLDKQTSDELTASILEKAAQEIPKRSGYRRLFKRLKAGTASVIEHKLGGCPVVDLYALEPFTVVCSEDDQKNQEEVYFYLYHSGERKIRFTPPGGQPTPGPGVEIERTGETPFRIAFSEMLSLYKVHYDDASTLEDLEVEFWKKFFADPNDAFDDDQYCYSPWWNRHCGERRTVADLKRNGDWNELWFKMTPRKTVNMQTGVPAPVNVHVVHYDFNRLGIRFDAGYPYYVAATSEVQTSEASKEVLTASRDATSRQLATEAVRPSFVQQPGEDVLNLMVLLKV